LLLYLRGLSDDAKGKKYFTKENKSWKKQDLRGQPYVKTLQILTSNSYH